MLGKKLECATCGAKLEVSIGYTVYANVVVGNLASMDKHCPMVKARQKTGQASDYDCRHFEEQLASKISEVFS